MGSIVTTVVLVVLTLLAVFLYWRGTFRPSIDATRPDSDEARILGTWIEESGIGFDEEVRNHPEDPWKVTYLANGEFTVHYQVGDMESVDKGTYKLDATQSPRAIDLVFTAGPDKGLALVGIYELDGDSLKTCWAYGGGSEGVPSVPRDSNTERPKEFSAPAGSGRSLVIQKREKQAAATSGAPSTSTPAPAAGPPAKVRLVTRDRSLGKIEPDSDPTTLVVSPDSRRFAYVTKRGEKFAVVLDGKIGPEHGGLGQQLVFSPDSKRLAYAGEWQGKSVAMVDGKPGKGFISVDAPVFSPDGLRVAYQARDGDEWLVVVDGVEGKRYSDVGPPRFSPDSRRVAYSATRGGKNLIVLDGQEGREFDQVGEPVFSLDSTRLAYVAQRDGNRQIRE